MPSVEDIATWTIPEIVTEIRRLLPQGCSLVEDIKDGWYVATIQFVTPEMKEPKVLWSDHGVDQRILLLNAFGFAWLQGMKTKHPAWRPRTAAPIQRRPLGPTMGANPVPDLDPEHIRSVYEKATKRK
jgi:hypothetical protein